MLQHQFSSSFHHQKGFASCSSWSKSKEKEWRRIEDFQHTCVCVCVWCLPRRRLKWFRKDFCWFCFRHSSLLKPWHQLLAEQYPRPSWKRGILFAQHICEVEQSSDVMEGDGKALEPKANSTFELGVQETRKRSFEEQMCQRNVMRVDRWTSWQTEGCEIPSDTFSLSHKTCFQQRRSLVFAMANVKREAIIKLPNLVVELIVQLLCTVAWKLLCHALTSGKWFPAHTANGSNESPRVSTSFLYFVLFDFFQSTSKQTQNKKKKTIPCITEKQHKQPSRHPFFLWRDSIPNISLSTST